MDRGHAARENMEKLMAVKAGKVGASQARAATAKPQGMSDDDLRKALGL